MRVRFAYAGARKRMNEICDACWLAYYPAYVGEKAAMKHVELSRAKPYKGHKNTRKFWGFIVERNGIKGYTVCRIVDKLGHLWAMYVDPKATGKGYGSALMGRALEEFRKRGVKTVYTETLPKNKRAIRFYERHGFRKKRMVSFKVRGQLFREWRLERAL